MSEMQQESDTSDKEFDAVRTNTFNFQNIRSLLIVKLKQKAAKICNTR